MEKNKRALDAQKEHWERTLGRKPEMFGQAPSEAVRNSAEIFEKEGGDATFWNSAPAKVETRFFWLKKCFQLSPWIMQKAALGAFCENLKL